MKRILLCIVFVLSGLYLLAGTDWQTWYERSGGTETPGYEQTVAFCRMLARASAMVHYTSFGKSAQGRDLPLLIIDKDGFTDPVAIRRKGRVILLLQACIHPGESEGKDAGLMLVRDMVIGNAAGDLHKTAGFGHGAPSSAFKNILDKVSLLFIPIFNVDGHERFGPYNRINQNGPKEMGWRVNANNLNLNRDYLKAETPEMKSWLKLFNHWLPELFIDSHTTDGADYQYVLTYLVEIFGDMDPGLTAWSRDCFIPGMKDHLMNSGFPSFPYVNFRGWHDPKSGLISSVAPPMLSQGYTALRNRPGLLIETHMLKPYNQRVEGTYECIKTCMEILQKEGKHLQKLEQEADRFLESGEFLKQAFPLQFETSMKDSLMTDFLGVEYTVVKSGISGGDWIKYSKTPATFRIPYFSTARPLLSVNLPLAYIIPVEWVEIIARLELHGAAIRRLARDTVISIQTYKFTDPKWQQNSYEGHHPMTKIACEEITETRLIPRGSAIVVLNQQCGRIIPHFLEPKGNGSMLYWGYFDAVFEQKEYAENYVLEPLALKMLEENPGLLTEFESKKASDTAFAKSSQLILNWFYNKSLYADKRKGIYPVVKIYDRKLLDALIKM
ncbi:MAG: M14 family metallopeptidase [Bacteroidetes bacterium]|nr:M14 family metallopeptidase [Bacteroidota bacterium]